MSGSKKGDFDPLKVVASAVLVLFLLIILIAIIGRYFPGLMSLGDCYDRGGKCREKGLGLGCGEDEYRLYGMFAGCKGNEICCKPIKGEPGEQEIFSDKEIEALDNAFIFTLNNDPTPVQDRALLYLKVDTNYTFHIKINDKLKSAEKEGKLGKCAVYVTDSREEGKVYYFNDDGRLEPGSELTSANLKSCNPTEKGDFFAPTFTPSLLDVYKDLMLNVILFDNETREDSSLYSNMDHWLAYRVYRLNVEPVVRISGMSGAWVAKDDITISCDDVTCTKFGLKLVKLESGNYEDMVGKCGGEGFAEELDYIAGTTLKTTGIPLNINFGGFRLPSQQKILYQTMKKRIAVVENRAEVTIDKATMISTFYGTLKTPSDYFIGDSTYLCVRADVQGRTEPVYGLSKTPLRVDILPPFIDSQNDIKVVYPNPIEGVMPGTTYSQGYVPYYYKQYPRVGIAGCYDYGQSGCAHYDYYIHTGRFVNLKSVTANWETGVKALLLTEGLNLLFNHLAQQDPLNTICPYMNSYSYRTNTNPEIRYPFEGQGIICLRIGDKVGNAELYWKEIWTPDEMFKQILAEEAGELASNVTT